MSTQPFPVRDTRVTRQAEARKKAERISDALYFGGAAVVTAGVSFYGARYGLIAAGAFCMFIPLLEVLGSFIRGIRRQRS